MTTSVSAVLDIREGLTDGDRLATRDIATTPPASLIVQSLESPTRTAIGPQHTARYTAIGATDAAWAAKVVDRLNELLDLKANWDSYGARPIQLGHVRLACEVLAHAMRYDIPLPSIVPTNRGGIQLEWHMRGVDLEVETLPHQRLRVSYDRAPSIEGLDLELFSDWTPLADCLLALSRL